MSVQEYHLVAPFKINLSLHVISQRDDGYHLLDGITVFTAHGDHMIISVREAEDGDIIHVFGLDADILNENPQNNLVIKLLKKLREEDYILPFFSIKLYKNIPSQAGYGGGSSDAACLLRWVNEYFKLGMSQNDLLSVAISLGADVPMCLYGKPCRIQGVGEMITPLPVLNKRYFCLLLKPKKSLPTPLIFKSLTCKNNSPLKQVDDMIKQTFEVGRNDLLAPSILLLPEIGNYLDDLKITSPIFCSMSGSGSGLFSLYSDAVSLDKAFDFIEKKHKEKFLLKTWIDV